jgi:hypothetical protein
MIKADGTGLESYPMAGFGIRGTETSGSMMNITHISSSIL